MNKEDHKTIASARDALPGLANEHRTKSGIKQALSDSFPTLFAILGEAVAETWITGQLRKLKEKLTEEGPDQGQLPFFGFFGQSVIPRADWQPDQFRQYYRRYELMSENSGAKMNRLAEEFYEKFGYPINSDPPATMQA